MWVRDRFADLFHPGNHGTPLGSLRQLATDFPAQVLGGRGVGYLVGVQLSSDPVPYLAALREHGLLAVTAGGNVVRLLPPLNVTPDELAQSVEIFRSVLQVGI